MKHLRKILTVIILLCTIALGVLFAVQNTVPVPLDLLVYNLQPRSVALWILVAFGLGGVTGMLMSSAMLLRSRAALGSTRRKLTKAQAKMDELRTVSPQESD